MIFVLNKKPTLWGRYHILIQTHQHSLNPDPKAICQQRRAAAWTTNQCELHILHVGLRSFYTIVTFSVSNICVRSAERREYTQGLEKNDKAAGGSSQCSYRSLSPKRQGEKRGGGLMVEYTPTRRIQKLWACMFWMLRRTTYFSCVLSALLFSPAAATQQIWGLRAAESSSGPMRECYKARYLCSLAPGSTDYQGRDQDQVQLLGQKQDPPHVSVFSQSSPTSAMCSVFSWFLTYPGTWSPCAPIMENMQK